MTRCELGRLREAYDAITNGTDRQRRRGLDDLADIIADAKAEHEAEDRAHEANFMDPVE